MPKISHLTTHRVVSLFSTLNHIDCVSDIAYKELLSRKLNHHPLVLRVQYEKWHRKGIGAWFYRLFSRKPEFMRDNDILSPEAKKIERKLRGRKK